MRAKHTHAVPGCICHPPLRHSVSRVVLRNKLFVLRQTRITVLKRRATPVSLAAGGPNAIKSFGETPTRCAQCKSQRGIFVYS
jgi:hypothetical protein